MSKRLLAMFREIVEDARALSSSPDNAPAVQHAMMKHFMDRLNEEPLHTYVMVHGINPLIREIFKSSSKNNPEERQLQLAQWPTTEMRVLVAAINNAMVYVPSLDDFVDLLPDAIDPAQTREAGHYLIGQGEDTISRGRMLLDLADEQERQAGTEPDGPTPPSPTPTHPMQPGTH